MGKEDALCSFELLHHILTFLPHSIGQSSYNKILLALEASEGTEPLPEALKTMEGTKSIHSTLVMTSMVSVFWCSVLRDGQQSLWRVAYKRLWMLRTLYGVFNPHGVTPSLRKATRTSS